MPFPMDPSASRSAPGAAAPLAAGRRRSRRGPGGAGAGMGRGGIGVLGGRSGFWEGGQDFGEGWFHPEDEEAQGSF